MDTNWQKMTPAQKLEARFQTWASAPGLQFPTPEAECAFKERAQIFQDVIQLRKPKRVPIALNVGTFPFLYGGITVEDAMYDYGKLGGALQKFNRDFETDALASCILAGPGKVFDILDYKLYRWPGHGVSPESQYQCLEDEYMRAEDYEAYIADPSNFFMRTYLPRIIGVLQPWEMLAPFTDILEMPFLGGNMVSIGLPPVQEAFQKFLEAGRAAFEWIQSAAGIDAEIASRQGLPSTMTGFTKAPFDTLGDTLRGTRAIMLDKFRRPQLLLAALEKTVPPAIEMGVRSVTNNKGAMAFIPLHKGADGFMSDADFKTFYWPTLKAVILGLVKEGIVPWLFVEGGYNQRLDVIADPEIPAGSTFWLFDKTDMKEVKRRFAGWAAFGGNVPVSLLQAGTAQDVENYVKRLMDDVAGDGSFILSTGAVLDHAQPENLHALIDTGMKYGLYR
jgi:hypothetical protein